MKLCTPAYVYLVFSAIGIIIIAYQNYGMSPNIYCVGNVKCPVQTTTPIFIMKILYVVFWTFFLNTLCNYGYYQLSWFLLLLPVILFFIMVFILGEFLSKRTASVPSNQQQQQQEHPFYQQQVQAQTQGRSRDKKGTQQSQWFPENWYQTNNDQSQNGGGGSGYYSSYSDYDHALDQKTNQVYNESHEKK